MRGVSFDVFSMIDWRLTDDESVDESVRAATLATGCADCDAELEDALPVIRRFLNAFTSMPARPVLLPG